MASPNLVAPITRLHDTWTYLLPHLRSRDISLLLTVGNRALISSLGQHVRQFEFEWSNGYLDIAKCLSIASRLPSLADLKIYTSALHPTLALWPFDADLFPKNLESLSLRFNDCITAIMENIHLPTVVPNLKSLSMSGFSSIKITLPENTVYPPKLTFLSLEVLNQHYLDWGQRDVQNLPKSLLSLELRQVKASEPTFGRNDFPPGLTSLVLNGGYAAPFTIENLPRTLQKLHFGSQPMSVVATGSGFAFPWRSYFPYLTELFVFMAYELDSNALTHILDPSIVLTEPRFAPIKELIASDPSTPLSRETRYTSLGFALHEEHGIATETANAESDNRTYVESLLPQLASVENLVCSKTPDRILHYLGFPYLMKLKQLSYAISGFIEAGMPAGIEHYPSLTSITCSKIDLASIPPTLLSLNCSAMTYDDTAPPIFPARSITSLIVRISSLKFDVIDSLPNTIETLRIGFRHSHAGDMRPDLSPSLAPQGANVSAEVDPSWMNECDKSWRSIATKMVKLKLFAVQEISGRPSMRLTPIASPYLEEFVIFDSGGYQQHIVPWAIALFDDCNTAGRPPIFPRSLKKMSATFYSSVKMPFSVISMLPRSLTSVNLSVLHPELPPLINCPFPDMTPEEILGSMPPNIKHFKAGDPWSEMKTVKVSVQALSKLPKSLESFSISSSTASIKLEHGPTTADPTPLLREIAQLLPPQLSSFKMGIQDVQQSLFEAYIQQPGKNVRYVPTPLIP